MSAPIKVVIGSDHGGFALKQEVIKTLSKEGYEFTDVGCYSSDRVDYPEIAKKVCEEILSGHFEKGILICGTGIGISIAANKFNGIRCALCHDHYTAQLTRMHNNANILAFGGRTTGPEVAFEMVRTFCTTAFAGERHQIRIDMITEIEKEQKAKQ